MGTERLEATIQCLSFQHLMNSQHLTLPLLRLTHSIALAPILESVSFTFGHLELLRQHSEEPCKVSQKSLFVALCAGV